jgi:hypothetical protein
MIKNNAEHVIPSEVEGPRCGTLSHAAGFLDCALLRSK